MPNGFLPLSSTTIRRPSWRTSVSSTSFSSPSTTTNVSSPSIVSMSMSPTGTFTSRSTVSGVWKRCSPIVRRPSAPPGRAASGTGSRCRASASAAAAGWRRAARPRRTGRRRPSASWWGEAAGTCGLLSAPAVAGQAAARAAAHASRGWARLELALEHLDEPRVHGDAVLDGGGVEPGLEAFRQAEGDPRREGLVGGLDGRLRLVADEHELRVAAGEPDLDPSVLELRVQLEGGL